MPSYYIPTSDEFCTGFEFEVYMEDKGFQQSIFDDELPSTLLEKSRVKILDSDDIKELGFRIKQESTNTTNNSTTIEFIKNVISEQPLVYKLYLTIKYDMPYVTLVKDVNDFEDELYIANMHIKNKSELKWILNRYGIL